MSPMPYYVSPEQLMRDRADFARKGIARGRSIIAIESAPGIVLIAENPSATLRKISEIYDHIAFAAVGKYNEFEYLRKAGVRLADLTGYAYGREDVTAKSIANSYANALGTVFTQEMKPFEVEILVCQVGDTQDADEMYRVFYDGTLQDEQGVVAMGGQADSLIRTLQEAYAPGLSLDQAVALGVRALRTAEQERELTPDKLEVAFLDRGRARRAFRRLADPEVQEILARA